MQTIKQKTTRLKSYDALTHRGQVRRLRALAKTALGEFELRIDRLEFIKHLVNTTFRLWSGENQFLVRVHREKDYTLDFVESELAWLQALSRDSSATVQTRFMMIERS